MTNKKSTLNIENAMDILKSEIFDDDCSYMGAVLFVSKAFKIPMETLLEDLDRMLIYDYSNEEMAAMRTIHCKENWSDKELEVISRMGLDVVNNGTGMWNEIMIRQALAFEEKYPQIGEGKYDYSLVGTVYNYSDMLPPIKKIIENRNDVAVFEIGEE